MFPPCYLPGTKSQSSPTLSDPMDCSLPVSSVHGIFQARVLEWGAIRGHKKSDTTEQQGDSLGFPCGSVVKNPPAMQETWVQSLGWEDPLKKGMATHSSILEWRIPWTEEPDRLQSMGSQRVKHN